MSGREHGAWSKGLRAKRKRKRKRKRTEVGGQRSEMRNAQH
jgi:hypothetical protein